MPACLLAACPLACRPSAFSLFNRPPPRVSACAQHLDFSRAPRLSPFLSPLPSIEILERVDHPIYHIPRIRVARIFFRYPSTGIRDSIAASPRGNESTPDVGSTNLSFHPLSPLSVCRCVSMIYLFNFSMWKRIFSLLLTSLGSCIFFLTYISIFFFAFDFRVPRIAIDHRSLDR